MSQQDRTAEKILDDAIENSHAYCEISNEERDIILSAMESYTTLKTDALESLKNSQREYLLCRSMLRDSDAELTASKQRIKELEEQLQARANRVKEITLEYESDLHETKQKLYAERKRIKYSIEQITTLDKEKIPAAILQVKRILVNAELSNGAYEYFGNICSLIESDVL